VGPRRPAQTFAARPDLLTDPAWRAGLSRLRGWDVARGLEVLAHQLPEMLDVVRLQPDTPVARVLVGDVNPTGKQRVRILSAEDPNTTLHPYGHGLGV
jgi:hypothetical protein